jgi:hypothetical protein
VVSIGFEVVCGGFRMTEPRGVACAWCERWIEVLDHHEGEQHFCCIFCYGSWVEADPYRRA